jgi:hypothetical protein
MASVGVRAEANADRATKKARDPIQRPPIENTYVQRRVP